MVAFCIEIYTVLYGVLTIQKPAIEYIDVSVPIIHRFGFLFSCASKKIIFTSKFIIIETLK